MFYNENINSYFERRTIPVAEKKSQAKDFTKFEDKQQALDAALAYIEKQYGKGAVMKLGGNGQCGRYTDRLSQP